MGAPRNLFWELFLLHDNALCRRDCRVLLLLSSLGKKKGRKKKKRGEKKGQKGERNEKMGQKGRRGGERKGKEGGN